MKKQPQTALFLVTGRRLILASAVISLLFFALAVSVMYDMRRTTYDSAILSHNNILSPLESDISRTIDQLDLSIRTVADGLRHPEINRVSSEVRQLMLFDSSATAKTFSRVQVLDERGFLRLESWEANPNPVDLSARDYFRVHLYKSDVGLFVGIPYVSRDGYYAIGISRRLNYDDGTFAGVVVATLKLSYFESLLRTVTLTGQNSIALAHRSGILLGRLPARTLLTGRDVSSSDVFNHIVSGPRGNFEAVATVDGLRRVYTFRHVGQYPIILTIAASHSDIFSGWQRQAWIIGFVLLALCAATVVLSLIASRELRRRADVERQLALLATTDELTGLANRRSFDGHLKTEWQRALRERKPIALLMIDADHFKEYNDKHGHPAGDRALATLATCLAASIRSVPDLAARYGGEEFAILLPNTDEAGAAKLAERVHRNIAQASESFADRPPLPTVSIGIAVCQPSLETLESVLVQSADAALYKAKELGRHRTEFAPQPSESGQPVRAVA